jgi:hypothetical protein
MINDIKKVYVQFFYIPHPDVKIAVSLRMFESLIHFSLTNLFDLNTTINEATQAIEMHGLCFRICTLPPSASIWASYTSEEALVTLHRNAARPRAATLRTAVKTLAPNPAFAPPSNGAGSLLEPFIPCPLLIAACFVTTGYT